MSKRTKDILIAVVALSAAAGALYLGFGGRSPKINLEPYDVLGAVTAEETAKLLGNNGQVMVMVPDTGPSKNPSVEAELKAFNQTLKRQKGIILLTEKVQVTPMLMMATGGGIPPEQFFKALDRHPKVGVVVLFFGFPQLGDAEVESLKKYGVKTVVVSSFRPGYKRLMEQQALQLAIVPRPEPAPTSGPVARTVRERFDQEFAIVTPADAAQLQ